MALFAPATLVSILVLFFLFRLRTFFWSVGQHVLVNLAFLNVPSDTEVAQLNSRYPKVNKKFVAQKTVEERLALLKLTCTRLVPQPKDGQLILAHAMWFTLYDLIMTCALGMILTSVWTTIVRGVFTEVPVGVTYIRTVLTLTCLGSALVFPIRITKHWMSLSESQMALSAGVLGCIITMFLLTIPDDVTCFDFAFDLAWEHSAAQARTLARTFFGDAEVSAWPLVRLGFQLFWACLSGYVVTMMFLPIVRFTKSYHVLTTQQSSPDERLSKFRLLLLHLVFVFPLVLTLLWIKPLSSDLVGCTRSTFVTIRWSLILVYVGLRALVTRVQLESYLMEPQSDILRVIHTTKGKIDGQKSIQDRVMIQFNYFPVVLLQYAAPLILLLSLALVLEQRSVEIQPFPWEHMAPDVPLAPLVFRLENGTVLQPPMFQYLDTVEDDRRMEIWTTIARGLAQASIIPPQVIESYVGFLVFWISGVWMSLSLCAISYWRKFAPPVMTLRQKPKLH